ncbi:hypothetical protein H0A65_17035 [Alcaligenaceae bacterium]|nr:hypothetical protein [Alcaligenaceae bacterium]
MSDNYNKSKGGDISLDDLVSTGKPPLAHLGVVDKLVRDFAAKVLLVKTGFHQGLPSAKNPVDQLETLAKEMGDIILGRNPDYDAQPCHARLRRHGR